jgi:Peroxiredoxin
MKRMLLLLVIVLSGTQLFAKQNIVPETKENLKEDRNFKIPLIGESAPAFTAESTNGTINFPADYGRKWKLLFSHPQDFTPVCSTEILELAYLQDEFEKLGVKICVISADKLETHKDWKEALEKVSLYDRKPVKIKFPLIDDKDIVVSKLYGMIHPETNTTKSVRGVFIIDPDNIIQAIYFYPMKVGRNTSELLRMILALQLSAADKVMTPANWKPGNDVLIPNHPDMDENNQTALEKVYYNPAWFLWFKKTIPE